MIVNVHVKAALVNANNEVLLLKATYKENNWDLPGGKVELPETIDKAIIREVQEEIGTNERHNYEVIDIQSAFNKDTDEYVVFIGYKSMVLEDKLAIKLSEEHSEFAWVSRTNLANYKITPYLVAFLDKVFQQ